MKSNSSRGADAAGRLPPCYIRTNPDGTRPCSSTHAIDRVFTESTCFPQALTWARRVRVPVHGHFQTSACPQRCPQSKDQLERVVPHCNSLTVRRLSCDPTLSPSYCRPHHLSRRPVENFRPGIPRSSPSHPQVCPQSAQEQNCRNVDEKDVFGPFILPNRPAGRKKGTTVCLAAAVVRRGREGDLLDCLGKAKI